MVSNTNIEELRPIITQDKVPWDKIYNFFITNPYIKGFISFIFFILLFVIAQYSNTGPNNKISGISAKSFFKKNSIIVSVLFYFLISYITFCNINDILIDNKKIKIEDDEKEYKKFYKVFLYVPIILYIIGSIALYLLIPRILIENVFTTDPIDIKIQNCPSINTRINRVLYFIQNISNILKIFFMNFPIYVARSVFPVFFKKKQANIFMVLGILFYIFSYLPGIPVMNMFFSYAVQYTIYTISLSIVTISIIFYLVYLALPF